MLAVVVELMALDPRSIPPLEHLVPVLEAYPPEGCHLEQLVLEAAVEPEPEPTHAVGGQAARCLGCLAE